MQSWWFSWARWRPLEADLEAEDEGRLRHALASRNDAAFDSHYGGRADEMGYRYWTPIRVATRVALLLRERGATRVLDVGAGPGKFCVVGASTCPAIHFTGVEQRRRLVALAHRTAGQLALTNVAFIEGDAFDVDWGGFDAIYFYNPFGENLYAGAGRFDNTVELSNERFIRESRRAEAALGALRVGTIVVTYHGIGGAIPGSYDLAEEEPVGTAHVRIWIKARRDNPRSACWRELTWGGVRLGRFSTT